MRLHHSSGRILALSVVAGTLLYAQQGDADRVIPGGGIHVPGWMGKIDASSAGQGRVLNDARLAQEGNALHITTGPAVTYWNPANTATGKLQSTDGVFGIRFTHNVEAIITGFGVTKG